jgi:hypothetical protein
MVGGSAIAWAAAAPFGSEVEKVAEERRSSAVFLVGVRGWFSRGRFCAFRGDPTNVVDVDEFSLGTKSTLLLLLLLLLLMLSEGDSTDIYSREKWVVAGLRLWWTWVAVVDESHVRSPFQESVDESLKGRRNASKRESMVSER